MILFIIGACVPIGSSDVHFFTMCCTVCYPPLTSVALLLLQFNFSKTISLDMFASIDRMPRIRVPVLISHGMLDTVVPIAHPQALLEALPERFRYTPDFQPTKGHNDMPKYWLYSLSAEKDPEARKKLEQTNKENKECIEKLKEFTSACMVRIYESPGSSSEGSFACYVFM